MIMNLLVGPVTLLWLLCTATLVLEEGGECCGVLRLAWL